MLWLLSFVPDWIYYALVAIGVVGIILSRFVPIFYRSLAQIIFFTVAVFGVFMSGGTVMNRIYLADVEAMKQKVAEAEAKSITENVKIVEKVVTKTKVVKEKGQDVIKYVDREVVKYDVKFAPGGECEIPKEFIKAHNEAAK
jgi:hypothetical protein